jgi:hypothetical protein
MAQMRFNANAVEGDVKDFERLPKGKYTAVITKTEMCKPNDKGTEQLRLVWEVVEGPCEKRQVSNWVTVACANREAVDIGMRFLKNVCESMALTGFTDTDELCGRVHVIDVGERKKDGKDEVFSEVKRCYPAGNGGGQRPEAGGQTGAPSAGNGQKVQNGEASHGATSGPAQQAQGSGMPPWARK